MAAQVKAADWRRRLRWPEDCAGYAGSTACNWDFYCIQDTLRCTGSDENINSGSPVGGAMAVTAVWLLQQSGRPESFVFI